MKLLIILLAIYLGFKVIGKYVFPFFINRFVQNVQEKMKNQQQQQPTQNKTEVGETVIDKKPTDIKSSNNTVGDYVDFEEVDE